MSDYRIESRQSNPGSPDPLIRLAACFLTDIPVDSFTFVKKTQVITASSDSSVGILTGWLDDRSTGIRLKAGTANFLF
jgi:hypothetical protein